MSFNPLAHSSPRRFVHLNLINGGRTAFGSGDMKYIFDELAIVKPSIISSTPRLWNVLYEQYNNNIQLLTKNADRDQPTQEIQDHVKLKFRNYFGDRLQFIVSGGAPTSSDVIEWMMNTFRCMVFNGYGSTETAGIMSDGRIQSDVDIKLIDVPEMGYYSTDKPNPRGEVAVKNNSMSPGYWKEPETTEENFVDGYFLTGDIGEIDSRTGNLKLIDRRKNFFKLAQGVFVAPQKLETIFVGSNYIHHIFIHGNSYENSLVAIVVPSEYCDIWKQEYVQNNEDATEESIDIEIKNAILFDILRLGRISELKSFEIPIMIHLDSTDFTPGNGGLTSTLKINRVGLLQKYKEVILNMYEELKNTDHYIDVAMKYALELNIVDENQTLLEMGGDSLSAVRLSNILKDELDTEIALEKLLNIPFHELKQYIKNKEEEGELVFHKYIDDLDIDLDFIPENIQLPEYSKERILLTGATGFLGSFILKYLLDYTPNNTSKCVRYVYCLVRSQNKEDALKRVISTLKMYSIWNDQYLPKIKAIPSDISSELFGLSQSKFEALSKRITSVVHCAAWVNSFYDYSTLRNSNVGGTITALKFAVTNRIKPFHYISTMSVCSKFGIYKEIPLEKENYTEILGGYPQTKFVAEILVQQSIDKGLPGTIFRPPTISGDLSTGTSNKYDLVNRIMCSFILLNSYPTDAIGPLHFVPVNFCASSIVHLSMNWRVLSANIFHPVNINGNLSWKNITLALRSFGYCLLKIHFERWHRKYIKKSEDSQILKSIKPIFSGGVFPNRLDMNYECAVLVRHLQETKGENLLKLSPCIDEDVLHLYIQHFIDAGYVNGPI
eukprot:TRINITY_DN3712_c0_g1_i2.p1 TRINITY_DN3712_c0_g1~~TRINITY_DN3712_c0_g1_i2.p1  ORF type:complete len:836 (-),score=160.06 TRINITY_DN3712_c0_g1_i2:103-2610(-)